MGFETGPARPVPSSTPPARRRRGTRATHPALTTIAVLAAAGPADAAPLLFPTDAGITVRDARQETGRRIDLPKPDCAEAPSNCADIALLNRLDGFDLEPRIVVRFDRPIAVRAVSRRTLWLQEVGRARRITVNRIVYDARTRTLAARPVEQLREATRYLLAVRIGRQRARTTFTTMSATAQTRALQARSAARTPRLRVTAGFPAAAIAGLRTRTDVGAAGFVDAPIADPAGPGGGVYAFGTFRAPQYLRPDRTLEAAPTRRLPRRTGTATLGVSMNVPEGAAPRGGWPVAVFGHGFGRSRLDLYLAARDNARRGLATVAIDIPGAGGGPRSRLLVDLLDGRTVDLPAHGRSVDVNRDGAIDGLEGLMAPLPPHPRASVSTRDVLRQAALDNAALVSALRRGVDVDGNGAPDLSRTRIGYYGASFGGIYGTILLALDPAARPGVLNVAGGPVIDVARLGATFRPLVATQLGDRVPNLLNGGRAGFTEAEPGYGDAPVVDPSGGAQAIQAASALIRWIGRSGSPEPWAPALADDPRVSLQVAFGDQTVPNPTSATLIRAGDLRARTVLYRNDRTPAAASNPHGFLLDPTSPGSGPGQDQALDLLLGDPLRDPDGARGVWRLAPRLDLLDRLNFMPPA